jgi:uncharacterized MAPEG superfamily protein
MDVLKLYQATVAAAGSTALLMLIQVLIADVVGIRAGHLPGTAVPGSHSDLLFRVTRVVANTNETIGLFILLLLYCVLGGASQEYTGYGAWAYVVTRAAYALCYYFDQRMLRSIVFALSLLALAGLLAVGTFT